ncbi:MATE family Na+-driven efflux transporter [Thalassospira xiamenensis]|uniref:MATE family Na+-driven efflux transporter n=1 Tax=Thalassospira xiamenensis TaxID=220697 RepID=UPI000DEDA53C|nr:MATE family Na+-driven efflux transporter [Thalassospira xiamenensis]RCK41841.1 hypothetical protein TH24_05510 [Thalassospira xiamenensis]
MTVIPAVKSINFRLWFSICLTAFFPAVYSTTRIYFLSALPDTWSVSIAAQAAWLHLIYEVLQEAFVLPLYFVLGQVIENKPALRERFLFALAITLSVFLVLTVLVLFFAEPMVSGMSQISELQQITVEYIRLEAIAIMINVLNDVCTVVVVLFALQRVILILLLIRAALTIGFDAFFVGQFSFSLNVGVLGVAWTNISVGLGMVVPFLIILYRLRILAPVLLKLRVSWLGEWFAVASRSGLESAARNLAFSLMILRLVNEVKEAGLFWVTNGFIWTWVLLPVLALGTLVRQDVAVSKGVIKERFRGYLLIVSAIVLVWFATVPGWEWFIRTVMGFDDSHRAFELAFVMLGFYVVFAYNHVIDSYFYGMGRTDLMLYQSLLVSVFYYGAAFIAYWHGAFMPTLTGLALLFGGGIIVDSAITFWQFRRAQYPKSIS